MKSPQKITPFYWLDDKADEAAKFYVSIFKPSKILEKTSMSATVELRGQKILLFNGGPYLKLNAAASIFVDCKTQKEVDTYWNKLLVGGTPSRCGWLTDKYGLSWQIVPSLLGELLGDADREKANRVQAAMMKMVKLDIEALKSAAKAPK